MFDPEAIRTQFPILAREVYGHPLVYLDSAATAQKPLAVLETVDALQRELNANVHRGVHYLAERMTERYEAAREEVRRFLGARSREEIIFTSGATAAINTVAFSFGERFLQAGDNIVVSEMEHHANLVPWQMAAERRGARLRMLPFDAAGALRADLLGERIDRRTRLVAVTQASNVLGTRPALRPIIEAAHAVGAAVMVDGCQGAVHGGVDVGALGCDFYAFSGHKLYGPTGIGVLYGRREWLDPLPPFMTGGEMVDRVSFERTTFAPLPLRFEAGTGNFIGAAGLAEAIRWLGELDARATAAHETALLDRATAALTALGATVYGRTEGKAPILSFNFVGVHPYDLGMILDKQGIAVRTGMHCAEPVMRHYGVQGMVRASFALYNTEAEVDALILGVERALKMLR